MPWTVADVDKHKKGLTPEQKKEWVSIANGVLSKCLKDGGTDQTCAPKAIRIANSKFSLEGGTMDRARLKSGKVPRNALILSENSGQNVFIRAPDKEGGAAQLSMVAYSGKVIENHWYWGNLVIDLDGMSFGNDSFPILEGHDTNKKIGFSTIKPRVTGKYSLEVGPEGVEYVDTEESLEFRKLSAQGFPFQASIYAIPEGVQRLDKNEEVDVNGFKFVGPGTVWRKSRFKEASVTVFGYDSRTESKAFSEEELDLGDLFSEAGDGNEQFEQEESGIMEKDAIVKFKEEHPDAFAALLAKISDEAKAAAEKKFAAEREGIEQKVTQMSTDLKGSGDKILALEKALAIRDEREQSATASAIWTAKLAESKIPRNLFAKVSVMIQKDAFVKDGVFDTGKFTEAVVAEIADWEGRGAVVSVLGVGTFARPADVQPKEDEKAEEDWLSDMISRSGMSVA